MPVKPQLGREGSIKPDFDPSANCVLSYTKERVGRLFKSSKVRVTLTFLVNRVQHVFVVTHAVLTGRYTLYLDGVYVLKFKNFFDSGIVYNHSGGLEGREVRLTVLDKGNLNPFLWEYNVEIDGRLGKQMSHRAITEAFYKAESSPKEEEVQYTSDGIPLPPKHVIEGDHFTPVVDKDTYEDWAVQGIGAKRASFRGIVGGYATLA